jgi:hypothetical protein
MLLDFFTHYYFVTYLNWQVILVLLPVFLTRYFIITLFQNGSWLYWSCLGATQQVCEIIFYLSIIVLWVYLVQSYWNSVRKVVCYGTIRCCYCRTLFAYFQENIKEQLPIDATYYSSPLVMQDVSGAPFNQRWFWFTWWRWTLVIWVQVGDIPRQT